MKYLYLLFLTHIPFITIWSDDIWFTLPSNRQPVSGKLEIKIYPPPQEVTVYVWIEDNKTENVVWIGNLLATNNYSTIVDTTKFKPGKYEIKAEYYLYGEDFDGDITIWVNSP